MKLEKSYEIVIFDSDRKKDIKYLPIHIKLIDNDLHEKIISFIESRNKDNATYIFDGYGGFIKKEKLVPMTEEEEYRNAGITKEEINENNS